MKDELQALLNLIDRGIKESDAGLAYLDGTEPEIQAARQALKAESLFSEIARKLTRESPINGPLHPSTWDKNNP